VKSAASQGQGKVKEILRFAQDDSYEVFAFYNLSGDRDWILFPESSCENIS